MGQGAEDADAAYDNIAARGMDPNEFYGTTRRQRREMAEERALSREHFPVDDDDAKCIIRALNHYEWDTHKVSGRFDRNPYTLTATVRGQKHTIHLRGRFGGVLRWLDAQERRIHGAVAR